MKRQRGSRAGRGGHAPGEAAARDRLEVLYEAIDRLTPDELARLALRPADEQARAELRRTADAAARRAGRSEMLAEARASVRDAVLARYSAGSLHPTYVALNWGVSQGTTEDRIAIIDALQDAATAAVVEDLVDPELAEALAVDAAHVVGLAAGDASEGSFDRPLRPSPTGGGQVRRLAIALLALLLASFGMAVGTALAGPVAGIVGLVAGVLVALTITRAGSAGSTGA